MNEFKKSLKEKVKKGSRTPEISSKTEGVDKKIATSITEILCNMVENSNDKEEKIQIMDRMLSINNLFNKGFDQEIKKLKDMENRDKGK